METLREGSGTEMNTCLRCASKDKNDICPSWSLDVLSSQLTVKFLKFRLFILKGQFVMSLNNLMDFIE